MGIENEHTKRSLSLKRSGLEEGLIVRRERWEEIQRLRIEERLSVSEISRRLGLDRKTVRRWLGQRRWKPYQRLDRGGTQLNEAGETGTIQEVERRFFERQRPTRPACESRRTRIRVCTALARNFADAAKTRIRACRFRLHIPSTVSPRSLRSCTNDFGERCCVVRTH